MRRLVIFATLAALLMLAAATAWADGQKPPTQSEETAIFQQPQQPAANVASSVNFLLSRLSINSGGDIKDSSASYRLGFSVGQPATGTASSASYQIGIGFWYGKGSLCSAAKGDMNADGVLTASDVVLILNCTFLGVGSCNLCFADVNCDGNLTAADVVIELNYVFLGIPPPCQPGGLY